RLSVEHGEHLLHRRAPSAKKKIPLLLCRHAVPPPLCQMHARHLKNRLHAGCRTLSVWCPLAIKPCSHAHVKRNRCGAPALGGQAESLRACATTSTTVHTAASTAVCATLVLGLRVEWCRFAAWRVECGRGRWAIPTTTWRQVEDEPGGMRWQQMRRTRETLRTTRCSSPP